MTKQYEYQKRYKEKKKKQGLKWCRGNRTKQRQRYVAKYPEKVNAHRKLANALIHGKIIKPNFCYICNSKHLIMAHHYNYKKPFDVIWVCWKCHNEIHKIERRLFNG